MKIIIDKETLVTALELITPITDKSSSKPILSNFLLTAVPGEGGAAGRVTLSATDYEISIEGSFPAQVSEPGTVCISAKKTYDVCREFISGEIGIKTDAQMWVTLEGGASRLRLPSVDIGLYPQMERSALPNRFRINGKALRRGFELTLMATQANETRKNLSGVCSRVANGEMKLIATDGHRLAQVLRPVEVLAGTEHPEIIIPRKSLLEMEKVLDRAAGDVEISHDARALVLTTDSVVVMTRLVEGKFPNVESVIPRDSDKTVLVNRERMITALRMVSTMSVDKIKPVKITLNEGLLRLETERAEYGDVGDEFPVDYTGGEFQTGFNAKYLLDVLTVADHGERIELNFKAALSPCLVKVPEDSNFLAVVMPLRLEW